LSFNLTLTFMKQLWEMLLHVGKLLVTFIEHIS